MVMIFDTGSDATILVNEYKMVQFYASCSTAGCMTKPEELDF
jgi:hypothetical protein